MASGFRNTPDPDGLQFAFRPIDLDADRAVVVTFGRDLFATSFADESWFASRFGDDGGLYCDWLREVTGGASALAVLALLGDQPVGMVVLGPEPGQPETGHVYHVYLCKAARGRGLGPLLNDHGLRLLAEHGFTSARLHVAPQNVGAIRFYERLGWNHAESVAAKRVLAMSKLL